MRARTDPLPFAEFVALMAFMVSIVAMATDVMLPALGTIADDLALADRNDAQLVVSVLFLGFAVGQLVVGPLSDSFGRKPVICASYAVFVAGCLLSMAATDFALMLVGRVLQGLGAAGPRVVTVAMARDGYEGRAMARVMSFVMAVFILVPALAPAIGQGIVALVGWRATFAFLLVQALAALIWFWMRQPETLPVPARRPLSARSLVAGLAEASRHRAAVGYTLATGLIFGAFLGYLSSAQQIFQDAYATGPYFALYFGMAALAIGAAALVNAGLVMQLGMRLLVRLALIATAATATLFLGPVLATGGLPPFWSFMTWLLATFFCMGILFGNLNALAMAPLGHMAGLGAALVGSAATIISLPLAAIVGGAFDGGVTPLVTGFLVLALAAFAAMHWAEIASPPGGWWRTPE